MRLEPFLKMALDEGALTEAQVADCRRLAAAMGEVEVELTVDEIAVRKGFVTREQVDAIKRALARRRVGKFEILEKLGEGGAGVVWRARDTKLDRIVALKILSRRMEGTDLYRDRFLREARVAVTLNHVNIVRGLDYGEADGYRFFAMEFVAGESLAQRLEWEGHLGEQDAFAIVRQVVRALEYVQGYGLVHRDIKPENLLLGPGGDVKLGDLGLAKPTLDEWQRAAGGVSAGTPLYMSPEQITDPDRVDWRSDVYSLGATLYHALTGQPPFRSDEAGSVLHKHVEEAPASPRELVLEVSQGAAAVVLKMLGKDPGDRYGSLEDLAADLEAVQEGRPPIHALQLDPTDSGVFERPTRGVGVPVRVGRKRRALAAIAGSAVLLAAGLLALDRFVFEPPPLERPAARPSAETTPRVVRPPAAETTPPARTPRVVTPEERKRIRTAKDALARADRLRSADPPDLEAAREQLAFVLDTYGDLEIEAAEAARLLRVVTELRHQAADEEFGRRLREAQEAQAAGRIGEAWDRLNTFPGKYIDTPAAQRAMREQRKLEEASAAALEQFGARIDHLLAMDDYAEARQVQTAAVAAALPPGLPQVAAWATRVDTAEQDFARLRAQERDEYEHLVGSVLRTAARQGVNAARRLRATAALDTYRKDLAELDHQLDRIEGLRERLDAAGPPPGGAENEVREWPYGLDSQDTEDVLGYGLLCLARADRPGARKAAARLEALSAPDEAAVLTELERAVVRALRVEVTALLDRAGELTSDGHFSTARSTLDEAVRLLAEHRPTHLARGLHLVERREFTEAAAAFEDAKPMPEAWLGLARIHTRRGRPDLAEVELVEGLAGPDLTPKLRREMTDLLGGVKTTLKGQRLKRLRAPLRRLSGYELEEQCRAIIEIESTDADALWRLGVSLARDHKDRWERIFEGWFVLGRYLDRETARDQRYLRARNLRKALEPFRGSDDEADAFAGDGLRFLDEKRYREAADAFRSALDRKPFLEIAHRGLGEALIGPARRMGADRTGLGPAIEAFDRLLEHLNPDDWRGRAGRAEARLLYEDFDGAYADAQYALDGDHTLDRPALVAGQVLLKRGDPVGALLHFETAFERVPSAAALLWQAEARIASGQMAQARGLLDFDLEGQRLSSEELDWAQRLRDRAGD